jgi:hypothetical protein
VVSELRNAGSEQDILTSQQEVDAIISETLKCYDDGAIEQDDLNPAVADKDAIHTFLMLFRANFFSMRWSGAQAPFATDASLARRVK